MMFFRNLGLAIAKNPVVKTFAVTAAWGAATALDSALKPYLPIPTDAATTGGIVAYLLHNGLHWLEKDLANTKGGV